MASAGTRLALVLLSVSVVVACGGDDQAVRFDSGQIPRSAPRDFPVPEGAVIGATMVDGVNSRTEFSMTVDQDLPELVQFFTFSLVNQGYVIERSESLSETTWRLAFRRGELAGDILISSDGSGASQAIVSINET